MEDFLERLAPIWTPHAGQREFLLHPAKTKVLACGRRWGKTDACAVQILAAMLAPHPQPLAAGEKRGDAWPTRHLILAPTLDQARLLFDRLIDLLYRYTGEEKLDVRSSPYPSLRHEGHRLIARSGFLGRALRGNEATHIVVDEAAYVPEELVTEVAMPMLATNDGHLTLISTPHGQNHFWRFFEMGRRGEHGIWSRTAPSSESPYVSPAFLEVQRELISERAFAVEYEAQFMDSVGRVFRTEAVEACIVPRFTEPPKQPFCVGVDWAKYTDYTAVVVLCGVRKSARLVEAHRFNRMPWSEQVERVAEIVGRYGKPKVVCDGTGAGDPLADDLRKRVKTDVESFVFTAPSKSKLINGIAWMIENAALQMEPHLELLRELHHFEMKPTPSGGVKYGSMGGFHDDLVIALALAASALPEQTSAGIWLGEKRTFRGPIRPRATNKQFKRGLDRC